MPERATRVTINDVARAAGVSRQTVSNAITHPHRVNPETLERVLRKIDDLGYRPSSAAQSLRAQRAGAIGIEINTLGPRSHNETMAPFLGALSMMAPGHGCHLVPFGSTDSSPAITGYDEMWRASLVDAFIIADTHHDDPRPRWLEAHGIPFASFGRIWDDPTFTRWADVDGHSGTAEAVGHVIARGYRTVAFLGWPTGSVVGDQRRAGWEEGLKRYAGPAHRGPQAVAEQDLDDACIAAATLIDQLSPGDAIVCASDILALGAHHVMLGRGLRPGRDLGLVGFDGSEVARMHHLTSVAQPLEAIAQHVLTLAHDALAGRPAPTTGVLLAATVREGTSTRSVP